jgi:hypothetical protein
MTRNAQSRPKWLSVTTIGFAATLLFAPSVAWAGSGNHDYNRQRTSSHYEWYESDARDQHASHKRHHRKAHKRHHRASHKNYDRGKRRGHHKQHVDYYCRECDRYFDARDGLYDHVAYRHRVPYRNLEVAISFGEFGWIFFGG